MRNLKTASVRKEPRKDFTEQSEGKSFQTLGRSEGEMRNLNKKKPELLIPASSLEVLKTAVIFGADAVYIGGEAFGLRAKAKNFSLEEMKEGVRFAHDRQVKVYVTANILAHNRDLPEARVYFEELKEVGPDALIISDPGMFLIAREVCPEIEIHISTQANHVNYQTFRFWKQQGASRVVTGRELSLEEIREIRKEIGDTVEIETFVHGAMCISYSGRCLLSNYFTGRDANQGACTHPCRWKYAVVETVARTYRKALDDYVQNPGLYEAHMPWYLEQIARCTYRQFTTGFFYGRPDESAQIYENSTYVKEYTYLGTVREVDGQGRCLVEQRNKFSVGEVIEIMKPDGRDLKVPVQKIEDAESGTSQESAPHARQQLWVTLGGEAEVMDLLRREET